MKSLIFIVFVTSVLSVLTASGVDPVKVCWVEGEDVDTVTEGSSVEIVVSKKELLLV